mgnify:CR=1 FL=1
MGLRKTVAPALREAAATRLRPVLMTTAATIFGHLPLVFVAGPGAAARNSIGIVLVADRLSALMAVLTGALGLATLLYALALAVLLGWRLWRWGRRQR